MDGTDTVSSLFGAPSTSEGDSLFGSGSQSQSKSQSSQGALSLLNPQTTSASLSGKPTVPSGGGDSQVSGIYTPPKPNYNTGSGEVQRLYQSIYSPDENNANIKPRATAPTAAATTTETPPEETPLQSMPDQTKASGYDSSQDFVKHGQDFVNENSADRVVGNGTTFGLNYDGSTDPEDNGIGAFGYNTRNKDLEGASLPISVLQNSIGDYTKNPAVYQAIKRGDYKVVVTNQDGVSKTVPIVDAGPAEWTGNSIDLTYKTSRDLGTEGKAKVGYQIIGPDGNTVKINGYHPHSVKQTNWDDHIGENRKNQDTETTPKPAATTSKPVTTPQVQTSAQKKESAYQALSDGDKALYSSGQNKLDGYAGNDKPTAAEQAIINQVNGQL
jgi:hypothetical protein